MISKYSNSNIIETLRTKYYKLNVLYMISLRVSQRNKPGVINNINSIMEKPALCVMMIRFRVKS